MFLGIRVRRAFVGGEQSCGPMSVSGCKRAAEGDICEAEVGREAGEKWESEWSFVLMCFDPFRNRDYKDVLREKHSVCS